MALKKIGFDFDRVLIDYPPIVPYRVITFFYRYGLVPVKRNPHKLAYRVPEPVEQKIRLLTHFPIFRAPILENIDSLKKLHRQKDTQLYLISGRFGFLEERTEELLAKYGLKKYFKKTFFNFQNMQPHEFKLLMIKKFDINIFIDDDIEILSYLSKKAPELEYFWITPNTKSPSKKIIPIENLEDFYIIYTKGQ